MYLLTFFFLLLLLLANLYFFFTGLSFRSDFSSTFYLPSLFTVFSDIYIYAPVPFSSSIRSTLPTSYLAISLLPTPFPSLLLCLSSSKTCITSTMAVPHQQEPSEPHSCPSRKRGRFTCNGPPLAYSGNLQLRAYVYYRQTRLTLKRPRLRTPKVRSHCCKHTIQTQNCTHYLRHSLGTPASHPPHSSPRLAS